VQLDQFLLPDNCKKDRALSTQYITDPHATGLGLLSLTMWALGYPDKAVMAREEAFKHAVDADHANTSGFVSIYAGAQLSVLLGDADNVKNYITNLNERSEGQMPHWAFISQLLMGSTIGCAGQPEDGIALMKKGMDGAMTLHGELGTAGIHWPHYMSLFAVLQARAGNKPASLSAIGEAKEIIAGTGEYFWHSDVLRIEGELGLLFGASTKVAEKCFVQALEIARKQEARSFELRAATSLARLWRDQGRLAEGRELLTKVCDWFTEGFGTSDWRQAQGVLRQLG
jgi:predicted ATPase